MNHSIIKNLSLVLVFLFFPESILFGDTVTLKTGQVMEGTVQPDAQSITLYLRDGSVISIGREDILSVQLAIGAPRACLKATNNERKCNQIVDSVSSETISLIDEHTGDIRTPAWKDYKEMHFEKVPGERNLDRILFKDAVVSVQLNNAQHVNGVFKRKDSTGLVLLRPDGGEETIPLFQMQSLTILNTKTSRSWFKPGFLLPGFVQLRSPNSRFRGFVLIGGTAAFAGIAGWSYMEAEKAKKSPGSSFIPLGGTLAAISQGNTKKFNQMRTMNRVAIAGVGVMYLANGLDLVFRPATTALSHDPQVEMAVKIPF